MKWIFTVSEDNEWNLHISLPFADPKLPHGLSVVKSNREAIVKIADLQLVVDAYKEHNTRRVNEILSIHLNDPV